MGLPRGLAWNGLEVELRGEADTAGDGVVLSAPGRRLAGILLKGLEAAELLGEAACACILSNRPGLDALLGDRGNVGVPMGLELGERGEALELRDGTCNLVVGFVWTALGLALACPLPADRGAMEPLEAADRGVVALGVAAGDPAFDAALGTAPVPGAWSRALAFGAEGLRPVLLVLDEGDSEALSLDAFALAFGVVAALARASACIRAKLSARAG